ncbi:MAG TPA: glycine--tRNA ligase subunit beta, partial [Planctomycetota bacterium]|nr:glycine--tRNA ligase subunit beta [Planctomycetota bacterium]
DGEPREVAEAIAEHYMPRSADGALPQTTIGCILSLAEKFDTMLGCFSVGLAPTGSQDPYALRRAAQGILRILMEREIPLPLSFGVAEANKLQAKGLPQAEGVEDRVLSFLRDRLYNYFTDKACRYDQVNAVLATGFDDVRDVRARLDAIATLAGDPGWEELVTVVQRTWNIIRNVEVAAEVDERLLEAPEEKELWQIILTNERQVSELAEQRKYVEASRLFAQAFVKTVHRFFEKVFVNVDDPAVRQNRLALMKRINSLYTRRIADLSQIVVDT